MAHFWDFALNCVYLSVLLTVLPCALLGAAVWCTCCAPAGWNRCVVHRSDQQGPCVAVLTAFCQQNARPAATAWVHGRTNMSLVPQLHSQVGQTSANHVQLLIQFTLVRCRIQAREAIDAADESATDQPGHVVNVTIRAVTGTITVDGNDAVSFAESATAIFVRPRPLSTEFCTRRHFWSAISIIRQASEPM